MCDGGGRQWKRLAFPWLRPITANERRGKICGHGSEEEKEPRINAPDPPTNNPSARSRARSPFSTYATTFQRLTFKNSTLFSPLLFLLPPFLSTFLRRVHCRSKVYRRIHRSLLYQLNSSNYLLCAKSSKIGTQYFYAVSILSVDSTRRRFSLNCAICRVIARNFLLKRLIRASMSL